MLVNILDAKNRLSQLIRSAQSGEEVIIANRGEPVARLTAIEGSGEVAGSARMLLAWLETQPLPEHARRTGEEIDASIEDERAAWD
jgi:prevent-host-death family protein